MRTPVAAACLVFASAGLQAQQEVRTSALTRMPVTEVTIFKDGHAFVQHAGRLPVSPSGEVVLANLPTPVLGTFWPYSAETRARLTSVTAAQRRVKVSRTALNVRELLEANPGSEVVLRLSDGREIRGTLVGIPVRESAEVEEGQPEGSGPLLPEKGTVVLVKSSSGTSAIPLDLVKSASLAGKVQPRFSSDEVRNTLTLHLNWQGGAPAASASVGMVYLQKGLRWIPSYRFELDGAGKARVRLQATLVNELTDLTNVTANLVIGVPSFAFKETVDPIALQQTAARLGPHFDTGSQTAFAMSNAVMSQVARSSEFRGRQIEPGADVAQPGPEVAGSDQAEDLFVFTVKGVSLRKGQRMVLPVAEFELGYRDIYTVDLPFAPPPDLRTPVSTEQQAQLARLFRAPKAIHKLRLRNTSSYPLTTAPALLVMKERALGQGMMTYTSIGGETDLEITTATDLRVKRTDRETARTPNAAEWQGNRLARVELAGSIQITNYRKEPVQVEVKRSILGKAISADQDGKAENTNALEDGEWLGVDALPFWWRWYNWPPWWFAYNGVGKFTWTIQVEPGQSMDLGYRWSYFSP